MIAHHRVLRLNRSYLVTLRFIKKKKIFKSTNKDLDELNWLNLPTWKCNYQSYVIWFVASILWLSTARKYGRQGGSRWNKSIEEGETNEIKWNKRGVIGLCDMVFTLHASSFTAFANDGIEQPKTKSEHDEILPLTLQPPSYWSTVHCHPITSNPSPQTIGIHVDYENFLRFLFRRLRNHCSSKFSF